MSRLLFRKKKNGVKVKSIFLQHITLILPLTKTTQHFRFSPRSQRKRRRRRRHTDVIITLRRTGRRRRRRRSRRSGGGRWRRRLRWWRSRLRRLRGLRRRSRSSCNKHSERATGQPARQAERRAGRFCRQRGLGVLYCVVPC